MASDPATEPVTLGRRAEDTGQDLLVRLWRTLEYSSAYLALVGAAEVLVVTYLLSLPQSPAPLVVALVTFAVYANDRVVDVEKDAVSNPQRTAFVRRHRRPLYVLAAIAYGVSAGLAALGGPLAFAITLLPGAAWVVYAVDWIDVSSVKVDRLKEIPLLSSLIVATAWSVAVVGLPVAFAGGTAPPGVGVLFLYFGLAAFVSVEVANVRDAEGDAKNGVVTLATTIGVARTRLALYGTTALGGVVLAAAVAAGIFTALSALVLSLGLAGLALVVALVGRLDAGKRLALVAECTRVPVFLALAVLVGF